MTKDVASRKRARALAAGRREVAEPASSTAEPRRSPPTLRRDSRFLSSAPANPTERCGRSVDVDVEVLVRVLVGGASRNRERDRAGIVVRDLHLRDVTRAAGDVTGWVDVGPQCCLPTRRADRLEARHRGLSATASRPSTSPAPQSSSGAQSASFRLSGDHAGPHGSCRGGIDRARSGEHLARNAACARSVWSDGPQPPA